MPLDIDNELVIEKNKLFPGDSVSATYGFTLDGVFDDTFDYISNESAAGIFVELLEVRASSGPVTRIVNNNDDISWGGYTWTKFRFEPGDMYDGDDGEDKSIKVRVSAINGSIENKINDGDIRIGDIVIYRFIHTSYADKTFIEREFEILEIDRADEWITFELGCENTYFNQFPRNVYRRNTCRYSQLLTDVCQYVDSDLCDRTFASCISLGQSSVFGGQPGIPGGVWIVS